MSLLCCSSVVPPASCQIKNDNLENASSPGYIACSGHCTSDFWLVARLELAVGLFDSQCHCHDKYYAETNTYMHSLLSLKIHLGSIPLIHPDTCKYTPMIDLTACTYSLTHVHTLHSPIVWAARCRVGEHRTVVLVTMKIW